MKWNQYKYYKEGMWKQTQDHPKEPTAGDTLAHLFPGVLHLPVTRLPEGEGQPACRPHCPLSEACVECLHVDSRSGPSARKQGRGGQQVALFFFKIREGHPQTQSIQTQIILVARPGPLGALLRKSFLQERRLTLWKFM